MWVVSFSFRSILTLFYHPNSFQWTEIHRGQGFICGSITVTFYVPSIGTVCGKLHFKLRRYDVSVHQRIQRFNQEQQMIFFRYSRLNKEKRKGNILVHILSDQSLVFGLQALIRSLIKACSPPRHRSGLPVTFLGVLGTSMGGRRPPRPR
jgi:hypothetical protein